MKYLVSVYQPEGGTPDPELLERVMHDLEIVNDDIKAAGAWVFAGGLHAPSTATVLQLKDGDVRATDGPFLEGKEYLGGISIIEAADLDEALGWTRRIAGAIGLPIELRPFYDEK